MADRYWVGGTATWDATAGSKWATTSGGTGGEAVPTAADEVFFDANSGAVTVTTSGTTTDVCRSINFTGFTGTFSHAASTTVLIGDATAGTGNVALVFDAGMGYTLGNATTSDWNFVSTSTTLQTVDFAGITVGDVTFNAAGGNWALTTGVVQGTTSRLNLSLGTLHVDGTTDNAGLTHTMGALVSNGTGTRVLTLGNSTINLTGTDSGNGPINWNNNANMTLTAHTATFVATANGALIRNGDGGGFQTFNFGDFTFSGVSTCSLRFGRCSFTRFRVIGAVTTVTTRGSFTTAINPASSGLGNGTNVVTFTPSAGSSTFSCTSGTFSWDYVSLTNIPSTGGAAFYAGANSTDGGGNTGWTFTAPPGGTTYPGYYGSGGYF